MIRRVITALLLMSASIPAGAVAGEHPANEKIVLGMVDAINSAPDSRQDVRMIFSAGDKVALLATCCGTQTGPFGPYPPEREAARADIHRDPEGGGGKDRGDVGGVG